MADSALSTSSTTLDTMSVELQNAIQIYKQFKQKQRNGKMYESIYRLRPDPSLNLFIVDGYIRNLNDESQIIPLEIIQLIKRFYPRCYMIYAIGWNHYGEFALGHNDATTQFEELINFEAICDDFNDIHSGWKRFIVRNCYNDIYCVGRNVDNDLGINFNISPKPNEINIFQRMSVNPLIDEQHYTIFSGNFAFHTFILSSTQNLYVMGQNNSSQCGYKDNMNNIDDIDNDNDDVLYDEDNDNKIPVLLGNCQQIFNGEYINKICCGDNFSLFLSVNGDLFSCGNNRYGSCGFPITDTPIIHTPTQLKIDIDVKMIDVNCGGRHVICISNDNNIWCFGQNIFNQLGLGEVINNNHNDNDNDDDYNAFNTGIPRINSYFRDKNIIKTVCGFSHTLTIEKNGNGYFFGRNHKGQCGKYHDGDYNVFETIQTPFLFQDIKDEENNKQFVNIKIKDGSGGYEHSMLITTDNQLIAFGGNASKQCSITTDKLIVSPLFMDKSQIGLTSNHIIQRVICGIDTTLIICSNAL